MEATTKDRVEKIRGNMMSFNRQGSSQERRGRALVIVTGETRRACERAKRALERRFRVVSIPSNRIALSVRTGRVAAIVLCAGERSHNDPVSQKLSLKEISSALGWRKIPIIMYGFDRPSAFADAVVFRNAGDREIAVVVEAAITRARRYSDSNPVTGMPGPRAISREFSIGYTQGKILAHFDIVSFSELNKEAGPAVADDRLRTLGRIIAVEAGRHCSRRHFVAHLGGDDFVLIADRQCTPEIVERILHRAQYTAKLKDLKVVAAAIDLGEEKRQYNNTMRESFRLLEQAKRDAVSLGHNCAVYDTESAAEQADNYRHSLASSAQRREEEQDDAFEETSSVEERISEEEHFDGDDRRIEEPSPVVEVVSFSSSVENGQTDEDAEVWE